MPSSSFHDQSVVPFSGSIASSASVGYETQDYEGGLGGDFSGLVYDVNLLWSASDILRFDLDSGEYVPASFSEKCRQIWASSSRRPIVVVVTPAILGRRRGFVNVDQINRIPACRQRRCPAARRATGSGCW